MNFIRITPFIHVPDINDVDALYAELKPALDTLPPDHAHGDKGYGQRELCVRAPDDKIDFGQSIGAAT